MVGDVRPEMSHVLLGLLLLVCTHAASGQMLNSTNGQLMNTTNTTISNSTHEVGWSGHANIAGDLVVCAYLA